MTVEHAAALIIVCGTAAVYAVGLGFGVHAITGSVRAGWAAGGWSRLFVAAVLGAALLWPLWLVEATVRRLAAALRDPSE